MLDGEQMATARVAVWLLARAAEAVGWTEVAPSALAAGAGLEERAARAAVGRLVARGYVALEKRGGDFWLQPTAAGRVPLGAYVLGFAAARLNDGDTRFVGRATRGGEGGGGAIEAAGRGDGGGAGGGKAGQ